MRMGLIAICLFVIAVLHWIEHTDLSTKNILRLDIEKTQLEIEKLNSELSFYREQEALNISVE